MDALILAAGLGTRMRAAGPRKPLVEVAGVSLLERGVRAAALAGATRVTVATGHEAQALEAALPGIAARCGVAVRPHRIEGHVRPNGHTVIEASAGIAGDYLLMMADHLFAWPILARLAHCGAGDRGVTLAIDRRTDAATIDPDDATWVETAPDGRIRRIGKGLERYDAVDCGAFLATPELAGAIGCAIAMGRPGSLSDGMQVLADAGRAGTLDIGEAWWIDVDDPAALALAEDLIARVEPRERAA